MLDLEAKFASGDLLRADVDVYEIRTYVAWVTHIGAANIHKFVYN